MARRTHHPSGHDGLPEVVLMPSTLHDTGDVREQMARAVERLRCFTRVALELRGLETLKERVSPAHVEEVRARKALARNGLIESGESLIATARRSGVPEERLTRLCKFIASPFPDRATGEVEAEVRKVGAEAVKALGEEAASYPAAPAPCPAPQPPFEPLDADMIEAMYRRLLPSPSPSPSPSNPAAESGPGSAFHLKAVRTPAEVIDGLRAIAATLQAGEITASGARTAAGSLLRESRKVGAFDAPASVVPIKVELLDVTFAHDVLGRLQRHLVHENLIAPEEMATPAAFERLADGLHRLLHGVPADTELDLVGLDQMAALVRRSKKTLERAKGANSMPPPVVVGGGGKPSLWNWPDVRPWLEQAYGIPLPAKFPGNIR